VAPLEGEEQTMTNFVIIGAAPPLILANRLSADPRSRSRCWKPGFG